MSEKEKVPIVIPKRIKKQRKRTSITKQYDVQIIPPKAPVFIDTVDEIPKKRVAAYCRVSTEEEAQASSFELQVDYYTKMINSREDWVLVDIYADSGISGTQTKKRDDFNRMIEDCKNHKIDMIITKSISRFARNVVDCLTHIRMLKNLSPPVSIYFEKERIDSLDEKMEIYLTMLASFAQEESRSISTNISWAIRNRMKEGKQKIPTSSLLGYDTDDEYNFVIIEQEAVIVRTIYKEFLKGAFPKEIADQLNGLGVTTVLGNAWTSNSVRNILRNEKYCGDVMMQKTFTVDYLTHRTKRNEGEVEQYFIPNHHPGIVSHEDWDKAQVRLGVIAGKRRRVILKQQRLIPLRKGRLFGYIPINPAWKTLSHTRLLSATEKLLERAKPTAENTQQTEIQNESEDLFMSILEGFEPINLIQSKGDSIMTVSANSLKFNKATAVELNYSPYVRMLLNAKENKVAIQPCSDKDPNAVSFSKPESEQTYAIIVKVPALLVEFRRLLSFEENGEKFSYTMNGVLYPEEKIIIYDIGEAKKQAIKGNKRKSADKATEQVEVE